MDIEQLKLILETIKSLGETAGYATVAVFATPYVINFLQTLCWVIAIIWILNTAFNAFKTYKLQPPALDPNEIERTKQAELKGSESRAISALIMIGKELDSEIGHYVLGSEVDKLLTKVRSLKAK